MKNDDFIKMDIDELKQKESDIANFLKYSNEHLRSLFEDQLKLAQELTNEKKVNDDLKDQLMSIQIAIEVKEQFKATSKKKKAWQRLFLFAKYTTAIM